MKTDSTRLTEKFSDVLSFSVTFSACNRSTLYDSWALNGDMYGSRLCLKTKAVISENLEGIRYEQRHKASVFFFDDLQSCCNTTNLLSPIVIIL